MYLGNILSLIILITLITVHAQLPLCFLVHPFSTSAFSVTYIPTSTPSLSTNPHPGLSCCVWMCAWMCACMYVCMSVWGQRWRPDVSFHCHPQLLSTLGGLACCRGSWSVHSRVQGSQEKLMGCSEYMGQNSVSVALRKGPMASHYVHGDLNVSVWVRDIHSHFHLEHAHF